MLRINLLPPYIYAGKAKGRVTTLWVVILLAVVGGLFFFKKTIDDDKERINREASDLEPKAKKADDDAALATKINTDSATIRSKADFARNAIKHDQEVYPNLYRNVVMYTWNRVLYDYIRPEGSTINMSAYTPTLTDVAHYIMAMERNPNISRVDIRMSSIPGFPNAGGQAQQGMGQTQAPGVRPESGAGHDFLVTLNLYQPIPAGPTFGGGGGGSAQPGGGMPGMPGSGGPGMMSGGGMRGSGGPGMMSGGGSGGSPSAAKA